LGYDPGTEDLVDVVKRHAAKGFTAKIELPKVLEVRSISAIAIDEVNPYSVSDI
jgi:hypothetical protein